MRLRFLPCVAFGFSVPPESDGEGVGIHLEMREVEVVVPALDEWRIAQAAASLRTSLELLQRAGSRPTALWRYNALKRICLAF